MNEICYIEDERDLANVTIKFLKNDGFNVTHFFDGESLINSGNFNYDLFILDVMLPGNYSGYDLLKIIKDKNPSAFVIFASARNQDLDKILGLELGSDDYLSKPFSLKELILRINNLLKRKDNNFIRINDYRIDLLQRRLYYLEEEIELTSKELDLLIFFVKNPKRAFSREAILEAIWGNNYFGSDRVVDDLMRRLRRKVIHLKLETIYSYGYRLNL